MDAARCIVAAWRDMGLDVTITEADGRITVAYIDKNGKAGRVRIRHCDTPNELDAFQYECDADHSYPAEGETFAIAPFYRLDA